MARKQATRMKRAPRMSGQEIMESRTHGADRRGFLAGYNGDVPTTNPYSESDHFNAPLRRAWTAGWIRGAQLRKKETF